LIEVGTVDGKRKTCVVNGWHRKLGADQRAPISTQAEWNGVSTWLNCSRFFHRSSQPNWDCKWRSARKKIWSHWPLILSVRVLIARLGLARRPEVNLVHFFTPMRPLQCDPSVDVAENG